MAASGDNASLRGFLIEMAPALAAMTDADTARAVPDCFASRAVNG